MTCEVAFRAFRYSLAAPSYKDELGELSVRIVHSDERELNPAVGEIVDEVGQLSV